MISEPAEGTTAPMLILVETTTGMPRAMAWVMKGAAAADVSPGKRVSWMRGWEWHYTTPRYTTLEQ